MNTDWQAFLATQGATIQNGIVQHFGDASAERTATAAGTVRCDLSQFGLLKVSGEDAQGFLQNLLSNDIREVDSNRAQLSSFNNAKGRMLASFLVWRTGDDYLLQLPRGLVEAVRKKLSMYVLRSKVKISDASDELVCLGISGPAAHSLLQGNYPVLPQQPMEQVQHGGDTVLRLAAQRFQVVTTPQHAQELWAALDAAVAAGAPCWDLLDVRAGIPFIQPATQEAFVAQMVNFELIGGINFKKGCYPGQEVVARMHYLGKPKRRMYLAHVEGDPAPTAGAELFSTETEGQPCGMVVQAAAAPQGGHDLLAVCTTASHETFSVHLGGSGGVRLQFQPLPYPLP